MMKEIYYRYAEYHALDEVECGIFADTDDIIRQYRIDPALEIRPSDGTPQKFQTIVEFRPFEEGGYEHASRAWDAGDVFVLNEHIFEIAPERAADIVARLRCARYVEHVAYLCSNSSPIERVVALIRDYPLNAGALDEAAAVIKTATAQSRAEEFVNIAATRALVGYRQLDAAAVARAAVAGGLAK